MCGPVNILANKLTYWSELECEYENIDGALLTFTVQENFSDRPWLLLFIQPGLLHAVIFFDSASLLGNVKTRRSVNESDANNKSPVNHFEADIALLFVQAIHGSGCLIVGDSETLHR